MVVISFGSRFWDTLVYRIVPDRPSDFVMAHWSRMIRFTLPRPITLSVAFNNAPNHKGRIKSAEYKEWQQRAMQEIMIQRVGQPLPQPPVRMTITVPYIGNADVCNFEKVVTDTIVKMAIIPNDSMKYLRDVRMTCGAPEGSCIVEIEPLTATIPHLGKVS